MHLQWGVLKIGLQARQVACIIAIIVGSIRGGASRESALPGLMKASPELGAAAAHGTVANRSPYRTSQPVRALVREDFGSNSKSN